MSNPKMLAAVEAVEKALGVTLPTPTSIQEYHPGVYGVTWQTEAKRLSAFVEVGAGWRNDARVAGIRTTDLRKVEIDAQSVAKLQAGLDWLASATEQSFDDLMKDKEKRNEK